MGRHWRDQITGLRRGMSKSLSERLDEGRLDNDGRPITDCGSALWDVTSIAHAASGLTQGIARSALNVSRIMWRLRGDPKSPLVPLKDDDGETVGEVADQGALNAWHEQDRQKRQENMRQGKKLKTGPTSGSEPSPWARRCRPYPRR